MSVFPPKLDTAFLKSFRSSLGCDGINEDENNNDNVDDGGDGDDDNGEDEDDI